MDLIAQLELELTYNNDAAQHVSHIATWTSIMFGF